MVPIVSWNVLDTLIENSFTPIFRTDSCEELSLEEERKFVRRSITSRGIQCESILICHKFLSRLPFSREYHHKISRRGTIASSRWGILCNLSLRQIVGRLCSGTLRSERQPMKTFSVYCFFNLLVLRSSAINNFLELVYERREFKQRKRGKKWRRRNEDEYCKVEDIVRDRKGDRDGMRDRRNQGDREKRKWKTQR